MSAQYSPTRHTEDGISPAVIVEETEMTYTAEPTAVPEPQRDVWEILAKSPSYEMRKIAAGRGLKVETFIKLLNDRAFCVREAVLDNIDGLETLASTEDGRRAVADALKDRTLRNTMRHRIRYIDEHAAAVLRPLLIKAVTEGDAVAGDAIPFELVLNPDTDPYTITLTEPAAIENAIDSLMSYDDFDDTEGHNGPDLVDLTAQPEYVIEKFASDPREFVRQYAAHYVRSSMPATRKLAFDESPAVRRAVCVEPKDLTNEERIAFYGDDPERLIDYVENRQELPTSSAFSLLTPIPRLCNTPRAKSKTSSSRRSTTPRTLRTKTRKMKSTSSASMKTGWIPTGTSIFAICTETTKKMTRTTMRMWKKTKSAEKSPMRAI